jgi:hypothetical protein
MDYGDPPEHSGLVHWRAPLRGPRAPRGPATPGAGQSIWSGEPCLAGSVHVSPIRSSATGN